MNSSALACATGGPSRTTHKLSRRLDQALHPTVFIDKDGTLIENVPYNVDPDRITLSEGAGEAVGELMELGYRIVVVTNQPGVALGLFDARALKGVEQRIRELLAAYGAKLDGFIWCPHAPDDNGRPTCDCRKPRPGMLERAAHDMRLDLSRSWMVGDILDDVEAGCRASCRTVLIDNGNETCWERGPLRNPHYIVDDWVSVARTIANLTPRAQRKRVTELA
ncbi:MAG TPA: HAD family hydrolase [Burkholderiaceae bacterium]|nr:HAD family hydrolase [Burkholderiaceae bacterium]